MAVDPNDPNQLAEPLRSVILRLMSLDDRISLSSGRRDTALQIQLRRSNGCPDIHESPASACRVPTARPGRSKHERGLAADLADGTGGRTVIMGLIEAHSLPLVRTVSGEPWHFEHTNGGEGSPSPTGAGALAGSGAGSLSVLTDTGTWLRIAYVLMGVVLGIGGLALIVLDLSGEVIG